MANKLQYQVAVVSDAISETTVSFALNGDESSILDCGGTAPASLTIPASWTDCDISFLVCKTPNGTFVPLDDFEGDDFAIQARAGHCIPLVPGMFHSVLYLKLKCSTPQLAARIVDVGLTPIYQGIHN